MRGVKSPKLYKKTYFNNTIVSKPTRYVTFGHLEIYYKPNNMENYGNFPKL